MEPTGNGNRQLLYMVTYSNAMLLQESPSTSQELVRGAEEYTKLLSKTLTNDTAKVIKTKPNIGNHNYYYIDTIFILFYSCKN